MATLAGHRSSAATELASITLRLVGMARSGYVPSLDAASIMAVGCSFEKWRSRTQEREQRMNLELLQASKKKAGGYASPPAAVRKIVDGLDLD